MSGLADVPFLTVLGLICLVGGALLFLLPRERPELVKVTALAISLVVLVGTIVMCATFDPVAPGFQFSQSYVWIEQFGVTFSVGVDGIALVLIALTAVLVPVVVLASWHDVPAGGPRATTGTATPAAAGRAGAAEGESDRELVGAGAGGGATRRVTGSLIGARRGTGPLGAGLPSEQADATDDADGDEPLGEAPPATPDRGGRSVTTFFALLLILEGLLIGVFAATDVFLFYVFFEAMLIPMYFLIGSYGGPQRSYAAVKFLLYSLLGGLLMLAAVIGLYVVSATQPSGAEGTFLFETLRTIEIDPDVQKALFLGFFIAFAIKAPLFPFHTWLPDAGAEAPAGVAVLLVGVLDKVGTFGLIRYCIPLFPDAARDLGPIVITLAVIGIFYGAFLAMGQRDLKRLVSYTSVAHFGFIALGCFAFTSQAGTGAVLYMVNHGLSTGALFLLVGFLIARRRSRLIGEYGGVGKVAPVLAGCLLVAGLSSLALPGTNSFVSEFLVLLGTWQYNEAVAVIATLGIVLAALYILIMYQRTMQGPLRAGLETMRDLSLREVFVIAPVLALVLGLGFYPKPLLEVITPAVTATYADAGSTDPLPTLEGQP